MENFTKEDLRKAFEAGQDQKSAEWENDTTHFIGYYNHDADMDFDGWFNENFKNE